MGLQEIEVDKIVGSTGRYRDFTRTFLPKSNTTEERWRRVDAVAHSSRDFRPLRSTKWATFTLCAMATTVFP